MIVDSWNLELKISLMILLSGATLLFLIANYYGLGYTYDSHLYVEIAEQMSAQGAFSAEGLNIKPPIYPLIIYGIGKESLMIFNLICLLLSMKILHVLGVEIKDKLLRWIYWGSLVFSIPLYLVHSFVWTEPPFIVVCLLAFYLFMKYEQQGKATLLYIAIGLLFMLPFIRFAGAFILIPTFLYLLVTLPSKLKKVLIIILMIGIFIAVAWVLRFDEGFMRRWKVFISPFMKGVYLRYVYNLDSYFQALSIWILPLTVYKPIRLIIAGIALLSITYIGLTSGLLRKSILKNGIPLIFIMYFFLLQTVFSVEYYSAERYLTPLFNLLVLCILLYIDQILITVGVKMKRLLFGVLLVWSFYGTLRTVKNVIFWNQVRSEKLN